MSKQLIGNRYQVVSQIGSGNQANVLLALDLKLDREVAIKILRSQGSTDPKSLQMIQREAMVLARFHHPSVVNVYDYEVATDQGWCYLVMEYIQGTPLDQLQPGLSDEELKLFVAQTCHAMQEAHGLGLIHRDLKPGNLMLADRGGINQRFKILDLGIAKLTETVGDRLQQFGSLTFSGAGTPFYMAPEQAQATPVDHRADIYAMGSMLYEFFSNQAPFANEATSLQKLLNAVVLEQPRPLRESLARSCPPAIDELVMQCLEKEPERRPRSMSEIASRFEQAYESSTNSAILAQPIETEVQRGTGGTPVEAVLTEIELPFTNSPSPAPTHPLEVKQDDQQTLVPPSIDQDSKLAAELVSTQAGSLDETNFGVSPNTDSKANWPKGIVLGLAGLAVLTFGIFGTLAFLGNKLLNQSLSSESKRSQSQQAGSENSKGIVSKDQSSNPASLNKNEEVLVPKYKMRFRDHNSGDQNLGAGKDRSGWQGGNTTIPQGFRNTTLPGGHRNTTLPGGHRNTTLPNFGANTTVPRQDARTTLPLSRPRRFGNSRTTLPH